jgi:hypothetical protein
LGRSFRSLTAIEDIDQMNKSFDLIMSSYINVGFNYLENLVYETNSKKADEIEKKVLKLLTHFIPLLTQFMLSEAVLQQNLSLFIEKKIKNLEGQEEKNQYILFLLYFMLLDIDLAGNYKLLDKLISNINILALKNVMVLKLMYYLGFKSYDNNQLEKFLREKIIELQVALNPELDKSKLIQNLNKQLLLKS